MPSEILGLMKISWRSSAEALGDQHSPIARPPLPVLGQPQETRHLVIRNEQAAISPSWSIHSGVGTVNYTFIWGMAGENQTFDDMDHVPMSVLK